VHLDSRISPRIFEKIRNGLNGILWGWGETDSWIKTEAKNLVTLSLYIRSANFNYIASSLLKLDFKEWLKKEHGKYCRHNFFDIFLKSASCRTRTFSRIPGYIQLLKRENRLSLSSKRLHEHTSPSTSQFRNNLCKDDSALFSRVQSHAPSIRSNRGTWLCWNF
jgi:hypothetical protein